MDLNVVERLMNYFDLNNPMDRFVAFLSLTDTMIYSLKPGIFFDENGIQKSTLIPWWSIGLVTGGIAALFF